MSALVPAIHPFVAILGPEKSDHTPEFATAAAGERGRQVMLASARALARTAADLLGEPGLTRRAWDRHHEKSTEAGDRPASPHHRS